MVNGITFTNQLITSANMAHFMWTFLNKNNGVTKGCEVANTETTLTVSAGYFIQFGRMVQIVGTEVITPEPIATGTLYCKLVFTIDLTRENTEETFNQGFFEVLTNNQEYPSIIQQDLDNGGTKYQVPFAQFVQTANGIESFRDLRPILSLPDIWSAIASQNTSYKDDFDQFFYEQQQRIEQEIADLEAESFLLLETARQVKTVTVPVDGWSNSAPYTQTIEVDGILAIDTPIIKEHIDVGTTAANEKLMRKAAGKISYIDTNDGSITLTCIGEKPANSFKLDIKSV